MIEPEKATPLLVRDLMTVGVATCPPDMRLDEIARLMLEKGLEAVIVLDGEEGHAVGMVSQDEVAAAYSRPDAGALTAEQVMRDDVPQVPADIPLAAAAQRMHDLKTRVLFQMHHAGGIVYPAAMLTYQHLLRHLAARSLDELRDLGIGAARKSPIEIFMERRDEARRKNLGQS